MRPLGRGPSRRASRPDPAPSRLAYRLHRLSLTRSVRRLFTIGLPLFALALIGALTFADTDRRAAVQGWVARTATALRHREEFLVRQMEVFGASDAIAAEIRAALPVDFPVSSFDLDLMAMREGVLALDAVETADLRVRPGGTLEVRVIEREPALVWRGGGRLTLIDAAGHRVRRVALRADRADLPLVAGAGAPRAAAQALELVDAAAPIADRLRGLVRVGERRWNLILDRGQTLMLPEQAPRPALERILALHAEQDLLGRDVSVVDMRNPARVTVRMGEATADALRQVKLQELGDD